MKITIVSFAMVAAFGLISCDNTKHNTLTEQAELLDRSVLTNQGKKLVGDSLFYDRVIGYGEAFDNVKMTDSINKNMLTGDYCFYNELTDSAFATKRAVAIDYSQGDSLYMHGDTLQMVSYNLNTDSLYRLMKAYHKVRMYRTDAVSYTHLTLPTT